MIDASTAIAESAWVAFVIFLRIGAAFMVLPGLGEQMLPMRIRLVAAAAMSLFVLPAAMPMISGPAPDLGGLWFAVLTETTNGLFLGLGLRLVFIALQTAGSIAAQSTSLSHIMGPSGVDPLPAIGHILSISAIAFLMATGFHVKIVSFFVLSYNALPALQFPDPAMIVQVGRSEVAASFALAFSLAAPFVVISVLYNLTLGVINKAMPQLMVAFVGAPVISLGAIVVLFLTAPAILMAWMQAVERFLAAPYQ